MTSKELPNKNRQEEHGIEKNEDKSNKIIKEKEKGTDTA